MRIGFDAKRLFHNSTGLGNYSRSVVKHYASKYPDDQLLLFSSNVEESSFYDDFHHPSIKMVKGKRGLFWRQKGIVKDIGRQDINIFHGLSNELPLTIKSIKGIGKIVTIHDLIFMKFPEYYPLIDRKIYEIKFRFASKVADVVIAVSEATKQDLIKYFRVNPDKIKVVYQSCDEIFTSGGEVGEVRNAQARKNRPYGLFVSSITERKNLKNVILALNEIKESRPLLYVVGEGKRHKQELIALIERLGLKDDVIFLGHLDNTNLKNYYVNAHFTVYPSFHEGFGIPIIESMFCGTPVITSNCSSMVEAAGGLATLVDPYSVKELSRAIHAHSDVKRSISLKDQVRLKKKFSAEKQVEAIRLIYEKI